jgi:GDP-D-mannose dehydratase
MARRGAHESPDSALGIRDAARLTSTSPVDFAQAIEPAEPDDAYNLAAQSSVALSFTQPARSSTAS